MTEGHDGNSAPAIYTLHAVPGQFEVSSAEASLRVITFGDLMRERTHDSILRRQKLTAKQRADVKRYWQELDHALALLRSHSDEAMRNAGLRLVGAALALGYYHNSNSDVPRKTEIEAAQSRTKNARSLAAKTQRSSEGTKAKEVIHQLCLSIWDREPDILDHRFFVQETLRRIHSNVLSILEPCVNPGSMWETPAAGDTAAHQGLIRRMSNHIGWAAKTFRQSRAQIRC